MSGLSNLHHTPSSVSVSAAACDEPASIDCAEAHSGMAATADNTRRRLSVDFLLNGGQSLGLPTTPTSDSASDDASTPPAGSTASASPSTNTSPRSSGTAHATRCTDVLSGTTQKLPPLASLLSSSAPAVTTAAAATVHAHRPAYQQHGRRRSWSTGGVVRPSAYIPPAASAQNWSGAPPDRRPVVTVATSGPLARAPPAHASRSSFFLPITALPVVIDIDRDLEDAELQHRQRQQQQQQQQLNYQHQLQQQRQRRPQQTQMALMMQKRKHQQLAELDRDEEEVARMLADSNRWAMTVHDPARRPGAAAISQHAASQPRGGARMAIAEAENVMSPAEDARRMQQHSKRRRHSAAPTLVAEAQRLFSSHLAATPILPASEAKELAAAKYGTAVAAAQPSNACDAMDEVPAAQPSVAVHESAHDATTAAISEDNSNTAPAIAPTYRKAEAFQFSPDQQDLLLQVLERTQQREAQRSNGSHNSEMDYSSEGRSDSISGASSSSNAGSSSGDDGDDGDGDEVGRLQRMAKKRKRVNAQQLAVLEEYFAVDPMPNTLVKLKLAETLGMSPKRVQIWFQNKRARLKKGEQKKLQELQQRHAASRLLTYHNLRIDDNGHIVFKDNNSSNTCNDDGGADAMAQPQGDHHHQEQFAPIQPQSTTTASAM